MQLPVNDARNLSVCLMDPTSGLCYDWQADQLGPFDPSKHLRPAKPVNVQLATPAAGAPPTPAATFGTLRSVDVGSALAARPNLVPVWLVVDVTGAPTGVVADVWPNPIATTLSVVGGWAR